MKRFSILGVRCRKSDGPCTQTYSVGTQTHTHIRSSRGSSRRRNKLVRKAGDKRARAHCPGIRDEQRCENVTTNSSWSQNVTSPLCSTPLPPSYPAPVSPPPNLSLLLFFLCTSFHLLTSFPCTLLSSSLWSSAPLSSFDIPLFSSPQKGREGSFLNSAPLISAIPSSLSSSYIHLCSFFSVVHPYMYLSIHPTSISFCESWSFGQQLLFSQLFPLFLDIYQTPPVHPGVLYQIRDAILSNEAPWLGLNISNWDFCISLELSLKSGPVSQEK